MKRFTRKRLAIGGAVAAMVVGGVVAYAYYSLAGTGSATAATGPASAPSIVLSGTSFNCDSGLYPGCSETGTLTVTNTGSGNQYIGTVSMPTWTSNNPSVCDASKSEDGYSEAGWFTMSPWVIDSNFSPGQSASTGETITFNDSGHNQVNCASSTITFTFASS